jgi:EAL domain-containing protein (putative c-di-GMP-specific phosphodiesterase class I)
VQTGIIKDTAPLITKDIDGERLLSRHDVYLKLRDKAASLPYVGSLTIMNAHGRLINFLRQWPIPNIEATDRDFFKASEWILREACRKAASYLQRLKIAINISSVQFQRSDLPRLVHSILLETGVASNQLKLKITEAVLIDFISRAISTLGKLKTPGVDIAMGDFGSGYSSLFYLHASPFDKIKIDRTFVGNLEHNHHPQSIVRAIITLGHSPNVPNTAEGRLR